MKHVRNWDSGPDVAGGRGFTSQGKRNSVYKVVAPGHSGHLPPLRYAVVKWATKLAM